MEASSNWQTTKSGIISRGDYLLESGQWSDCKFVVGQEPHQESFEAHKLFLAMSSPVFERMFYGSMPESDEGISVTDVQPDAFRALLKFIYTDRMEFESFDDALDLYYCAKKYMLPYLAAKCTDYVHENLLPYRVCRVYEFARLFEEPMLLERCLRMMRVETTEIIRDYSWKSVQIDTVATILNENTLRIESEIDLYNGLLRWAVAECERRALSSNDQKSLRSVTGDLVGKIRFLTLTPQQFAHGPGKAELLTKDEAFAIIMNISSTDLSGVAMPAGFTTLKEQRERPEPALIHDNFPHDSIDCLRSSLLPGQSFNNDRKSPPRIQQIVKGTRPSALCTSKAHLKRYCIRDTGRTSDCVNLDVLDCSVTFKVNTRICILGVQVTTQLIRNSQNPGHALRYQNYTEILYAYLDSDGSRITYTHYTTAAACNSSVDINFNTPVNININQVYRIGVVFNKAGTYPLSECFRESFSEGVKFTFGVGRRIDNVRDGLIKAILFACH